MGLQRVMGYKILSRRAELSCVSCVVCVWSSTSCCCTRSRTRARGTARTVAVAARGATMAGCRETQSSCQGDTQLIWLIVCFGLSLGANAMMFVVWLVWS